MFETLSNLVNPQEGVDMNYIQGRVLRKFPLLGVQMSKLKFIPSESVRTAATNGKTVFYSPKFFKKLSEDEQIFVIAHEVMHVAFNHVVRSKDKIHKLWNIATDSVINQILKSENLPLVKGGIDLPEAINQDAEEMYKRLLKNREDKKQKQQQKSGDEKHEGDTSEQEGDSSDPKQGDSQSGEQNESQNQDGAQEGDENQKNNDEQGGGEGQDSSKQEDGDGQEGQDTSSKMDEYDDGDDENEQVGHDNHTIWKESAERAEQENTGSQKSGGGRSFDDDKDKEDAGKDSSATEQESEKDFLQNNRRERAEMAQKIRDELEQQKNAHLAQAKSGSFGDVGESKSILDWKKVLKKTLEDEQDRWSYRRSNADNDYMARVETLEDEERPDTQVLLDTSGSVSNTLLKEFLRQLKPLLKTSKLFVGCFDSKFYGFTEIKTIQDIDTFQIKGGGGTDLDLAAKSFTKNKDTNKLVFTDGIPGILPGADTKGINVLWLVYKNRNYRPVCGKVIQVDTNQILNRLITRPSGRGNR